MNKTVFMSAYAKVQASDEFKRKAVELLKSKNQQKKHLRLKTVIPIAASLAVIIGVLTVYSVFQKTTNPIPNVSSTIINTDGSITIPKIKLPNGSDQMASMIPLVVYKGRIYTTSVTRIGLDDAKKLIGDKLGTAKGNLDEWSKQDDYAVELASDISGDVYSVKGYDSNFRIMIVSKSSDGTESAGFLDCLNGITVSSGKDVLGKLNVKGDAVSLTYVQWYDGQTPIYTVDDESLMNRFIDALNNTTPCIYDQDQIQGVDLNVYDSTNIRYIIIALKDGSTVQLKLVKGGYIFYGNTVFKMTNNVFNELWDKLDYSKDPSTKKN